MLAFLKDNDSPKARADIARAFGVKGADRPALRALLAEMEADGTLSRHGRARFADASSLPSVLPLDIMSVDDDGDLVCLPAGWEGASEPPMIRLAAKSAAKARPAPGVGDRFLGRLRPAGDDGYVADIIKPLGRGAHRFLAVFRSQRYGGVAEPVERRARGVLTIDKADAAGARDGDLVWVETLPHRGPRATRGRVRSIAGHVDDRNAYSLIALAAHGARIEMPEHVVAEAEEAAPPPLGARTDLRALPLVTIDPEDAKDHDDAVFAEPDDDAANPGGWRVVVAIADVSWFVRPGTALDDEARERGNSIYLPDRVVPMLPERLSNDLCSLKDGVDRPCLAVEMILDKGGHKRSHRFMRAMMRSAAKLSYGDAQAIMDGASGPAVETRVRETIAHLKGAFEARWSERSKRAPLDLDLPERRVLLKSDGTVDRVVIRERFAAHRLIEEFMILANVAAAETLERAKTPQIYRVHDAPDEAKLEGLRDYLEGLGYSLLRSSGLRPQHFNQLLKIAEERGEKELVSEVVLRSQQQAVYAVENLGHFGLNLGRYSHFTSPIRRYADLTVHRALVSACRLGEGGQTAEEAARLAKTADHISETERTAMAAERDAKDRYLAGYLETKIGEAFDGRIRGVTRFGLFVSLSETGADGFVPLRSLGPERYVFDEARHAVIGERSGAVYRLGQAVEVRLAEAAPLRGGLRFDMLSDPLDPGSAGVARPVRKSRRGVSAVKSGNPVGKPKRSASRKTQTARSNAKRRRQD